MNFVDEIRLKEIETQMTDYEKTNMDVIIESIKSIDSALIDELGEDFEIAGLVKKVYLAAFASGRGL